MMEEKMEVDFIVECNVCKTQYKNHAGSTPCCGSIAYLVEDGESTSTIKVWAKSNNEQGEKG